MSNPTFDERIKALKDMAAQLSAFAEIITQEAATKCIAADFSVARANAVHAPKGASNQGLAADAFFQSPTTVNGITVTPFDDQGTIFDIFQIPSSFTSGTPFALTFSNIANGYGKR